MVENKVPEKVLCTAEAYPEASFMWRFNDEIIQTQVPSDDDDDDDGGGDNVGESKLLIKPHVTK